LWTRRSDWRMKVAEAVLGDRTDDAEAGVGQIDTTETIDQ